MNQNKQDQTYFPVTPFQILIDLSNDALAIILPSGEKAASLITCWCPTIRVIQVLLFSGSHSDMVWSSELETIRSGWSFCNIKKENFVVAKKM